jgi:putative endonuclease
MLECADGSFYVGSTRCLDSRGSERMAGRGARYTRCRCPVQLIWAEEMGRVDVATTSRSRRRGGHGREACGADRGRHIDLPRLAKRGRRVNPVEIGAAIGERWGIADPRTCGELVSTRAPGQGRLDNLNSLLANDSIGIGRALLNSAIMATLQTGGTVFVTRMASSWPGSTSGAVWPASTGGARSSSPPASPRMPAFSSRGDSRTGASVSRSVVRGAGFSLIRSRWHQAIGAPVTQPAVRGVPRSHPRSTSGDSRVRGVTCAGAS